MKTRFKLLGSLILLVLTARALSASVYTTATFTLNYTDLTAGTLLPFQLPKSDPALGTLQNINISWDLYGTEAGTATGVNQSDSIDSTVTHWVFFDFEDNGDNVGIAEPALYLTDTIPAGAQNVALSFGPQYQSTSETYSVGHGPGFNAWANGPGTINGTLHVFFDNNTVDDSDLLHFYPGSDSGVYNGSLSISYNYAPVPEPNTCALMLVGLLLMLPMRRIAAVHRNSASLRPIAER